MGSAAFGPAALDACFPFRLVVDADLGVVSAGPGLLRLLPELAGGDRIDAYFEPLLPEAPLTWASLKSRPHDAVLLRSRRLPLLVLHAQILELGGASQLAFVGGLRVTLESFESLGLTLDDFAPHDQVADFLSVVHAQQEALAAAASASEALGELNRELERRVEERTASLEAEKRSRERVQDELRLAQRLEAVGQLAAGVAHEINTPIQYVGDSLHFLRSACDDIVPMLSRIRAAAERGRGEAIADEIALALDDADAQFLLEQIPRALDRTFDGIDRVASIVRAMKAFAHPGSDGRAPADLNEALRNTLVVARNEYKYVADVEHDLGELPPVVCSLGELNQVFLNLVVNASHAIAEVAKKGDRRGKLVVRSRAEGDHVVIEIADTGTGIPEELRHKIFDPFFTTKPVGKGTGQGLTIARSIVAKHGGTLTFTSEAGEGTTFSIRLPAEAREECAA